MSATSKPPASLPIIDLAPSFQGAEGFRAVARQIDEVCRRHGFFYIVNHGVPAELRSEIFAQSKAFFDQADDAKAPLNRKLSRTGRGYSALGAQALNSGKPADLHEGFSVGLEVDPTDPMGEDAPRRGGNLWPSEPALPGFRDSLSRYMTALDKVGRHLMSLVAEGLGLPADHFVQYM